MLIGNCMGATAALQFCGDLPNAYSVVAFNPVIDPNTHVNGRSYRLALWMMPKALSEHFTSTLLDSVRRAAASSSAEQRRRACKIAVHIYDSPPEQQQISLLPKQSENGNIHICTYPCNEKGEGGVPKYLKAKGLLSTVLSDAYTAMINPK